jgi:hypothetical protein
MEFFLEHLAAAAVSRRFAAAAQGHITSWRPRLAPVYFFRGPGCGGRSCLVHQQVFLVLSNYSWWPIIITALN